MNNQNPIENYIVERIKELELEIKLTEKENDELKRYLKETEAMKEKMREYFSLKKYDSGSIYIDYSYNYNSKYIQEIAQFIGLECGNQEDEDD